MAMAIEQQPIGKGDGSPFTAFRVPRETRGGLRSVSDVTAVDTEQVRPAYPRPLREVATIIHGNLAPHHERILDRVDRTDWAKEHWNIRNPRHRGAAALALTTGIPGFTEFGNFKALVFHPDQESMRTVNVSKGRQPDQVASIVTTREHMPSIFDWKQLPEGVSQADIMRMMDAFYDRRNGSTHREFAGPFGFRGPAADHIPDHLTTVDPTTGLRTVQIIAPGYDCVLNPVLEEAIDIMRVDGQGLNYLAVTSANPSSNKFRREDGSKPDIPAHFLMSGVQGEFSNRAEYGIPYFMLGHRNARVERRVRESYPHHVPNSTTILDFSHMEVADGRPPRVHMARHGSLSDENTSAMVAALGMELVIGEDAKAASELRVYPREGADRSHLWIPSRALIFSRHSK